MSKRFIVLVLSVAGCLESGGAPGADPTEQVTSAIEYATHDHLFVQTQRTWGQAQTACNQNGYHLATIGDSLNNEWVRAQAAAQNPGLAWWIGRNDIATETFWKWENNEPLRYDNWGPGQPDNFNNEDCATIQPGTGQWNDLSCTASLPFVCELDNSQPQPGWTFNYSVTNTSSATQNYSQFQVFGVAGLIVSLGTCGQPGAVANGDTYLRVFDPTNTVQVAANDDACGGWGSSISFLSTQSGNYYIHAGCFGSNSCSGTIKVYAPRPID